MANSKENIDNNLEYKKHQIIVRRPPLTTDRIDTKINVEVQWQKRKQYCSRKALDNNWNASAIDIDDWNADYMKH